MEIFCLIHYIIYMDNNLFWRRVKELIKTHNMTQKQFADHLGFSQNTFKGWIYHNRIPELSSAYAIAYALGVSLDYLVGGKDKDIVQLRLKNLESRKSAARALKMIEKVQKELLHLRPLV